MLGEQDLDSYIFVLSVEQEHTQVVERVLEAHRSDYSIHFFEDANSTLAHLHLQAEFLLVILSPSLPLADDFFKTCLDLSPNSKICCIGFTQPLSQLTKLMRIGIYDYWDIETDYSIALKALLTSNTATSPTKNTLVEQFRRLGIIGNSKLSKRLYKKVLKAVQVDTTILIQGEHGTGKELIAKTIHQLSRRGAAAFIVLDCLSWPTELLEEQLFGREKNVFEGNLKRKIGSIESASGGTLVLDHPHILPLYLQERLLRALQERKFIRPGGSNIVFFNARLIVLDRGLLERSVEAKQFRKDLYQQLLGYPIKIPALRKRPSDILLLANHFLRAFIRRNKIKSLIFTAKAKAKLQTYAYLGNIRELKLLVEIAATNAVGTEITPKDIQITSTTIFPLEEWLEEGLNLEEITYEAIQYYLKKFNGNVFKAAEALKIGKSTIYRILNKQ